MTKSSSPPQEFPKMLYRLCDDDETQDVINVHGRTVKYKIVSNAAEQKTARGWSAHPDEAANKQRFRHWARTLLKPWWEKWEWAIKFLAAILVVVAAALKIVEVFPSNSKLSQLPSSAPAASKRVGP